MTSFLKHKFRYYVMLKLKRIQTHLKLIDTDFTSNLSNNFEIDLKEIKYRF